MRDLQIEQPLPHLVLKTFLVKIVSSDCGCLQEREVFFQPKMPGPMFREICDLVEFALIMLIQLILCDTKIRRSVR